MGSESKLAVAEQKATASLIIQVKYKLCVLLDDNFTTCWWIFITLLFSFSTFILMKKTI